MFKKVNRPQSAEERDNLKIITRFFFLQAVKTLGKMLHNFYLQRKIKSVQQNSTETARTHPIKKNMRKVHLFLDGRDFLAIYNDDMTYLQQKRVITA